jgi:DNA-3-methyladenine glycosylase II
LPRNEILKAGLSKRKYEYVADLAKAVENNKLQLSDLSKKDDEIIRVTLKRIRGIGDWTVDMYLLFGLARLDVLPIHDLALRRIISDAYGINQDDRNRIEQIADRWKPFRSVACWYFYKHGNLKS